MDVFIHIPKTAGSSIRRLLSRQYSVSHIMPIDEESGEWQKFLDNPTLLKLYLDEHDISLLSGHMSFGVHSVIRQPCRYFSLLRDPINRAVSDFFYAYSYPHHRYRNEILSGNIGVFDFISDPEIIRGDGQAAMLAGHVSHENQVVPTAIENIKTCIAAVGTTERFDESVLLIAKTLGWKPPFLFRTNVTRLDADLQLYRQRLLCDANRRFSEYYAPDYEVYNAVDQLLTDRITAEGPAFQRALAAIREIKDSIAQSAGDIIFERYELGEESKLPPGAARYFDSTLYHEIENYLCAESKVTAPRANFDGWIDAMGGRTIIGWATDLWKDTSIDVAVWRGAELIARAAADGLRPDVASVGYPSKKVGFRISLDSTITNVNEYRVCFGDTKIAIPHDP
jgi:hypothetical protein